VRDCRLGAGSEARHNEILKLGSRETPKAVNRTRCFEEVALFHVVSEEVTAESHLTSLASSEVASLSFCDFI